MSEIKDLSKLDPELDLGIDIEKLENAFNGPLLDNVTTTEDISNQNHEEDLESNQLKTSIEE